MKTISIVLMILQTMSPALAQNSGPANPTPIDFPQDAPGFYVDTNQQVHSDTYTNKSAGDGHTLYTPKSSNVSHLFDVASVDGKIQYIAQIGKNHDHSVSSFGRNSKIESQTNCYGNECFNVTPQLCTKMLTKASVASFADLYAKQKSCGALALAYEQSLNDPAVAHAQDEAWKTNSARMTKSLTLSNQASLLREFNSLIGTGDPARRRATTYAVAGAALPTEVARICLKYEATGAFSSASVDADAGKKSVGGSL